MRYDGKQGCSVNYILLRTLNNGKLANNNMEVMDNTTTANTITTHDYSDLSTPHCTYAYIHTHKSTQTHTFAHFSFCFGTHTLALLSHFDMLVRVSVERGKSKPARSSRCVWVCMCARECVYVCPLFLCHWVGDTRASYDWPVGLLIFFYIKTTNFNKHPSLHAGHNGTEPAATLHNGQTQKGGGEGGGLEAKPFLFCFMCIFRPSTVNVRTEYRDRAVESWTWTDPLPESSAVQLEVPCVAGRCCLVSFFFTFTLK